MADKAERDCEQEAFVRELLANHAGFIPKGSISTDQVLAYVFGMSVKTFRQHTKQLAVAEIGNRLIYDTDRLIPSEL